MSRTATSIFAALGLAALGVPTAASALPQVTFKATAVPIPGFRHTGNILGAGAALRVQYSIRGTEYGGAPAPLVGVNVYTPAGTKLHSRGFATCSAAALRNIGPRACPRRSRATIAGSALGIVTFGSERVPERASIKAFFAPGGGMQFYTAGSSPVSLEFLAPSHVRAARAPYAQQFITSVPLIETVPGAPDASTLSIDVTVGAAFRHGHKATYYGTAPRRCPRGGFPVKSELAFAAPDGLAPQIVTVNNKMRCPRRHR